MRKRRQAQALGDIAIVRGLMQAAAESAAVKAQLVEERLVCDRDAAAGELDEAERGWSARLAEQAFLPEHVSAWSRMVLERDVARQTCGQRLEEARAVGVETRKAWQIALLSSGHARRAAHRARRNVDRMVEESRLDETIPCFRGGGGHGED